MASAENLFRRHWKSFCNGMEHFDDKQNHYRAMIFSASIIAEAIRLEQDETEFKGPETIDKIKN